MCVLLSRLPELPGLWLDEAIELRVGGGARLETEVRGWSEGGGDV
jgi:hypothetical protein